MRNRGFTLIELLVVVAIIAILMAVLLPGLRLARRQAKLVTAHADLRGITTALAMYLEESDNELPPTRASCSTRQADELPIELGQRKLLPTIRVKLRIGNVADWVEKIDMPDVFSADQSLYSYRAPGPKLQNGALLPEAYPPQVRNAWLWVPDNFESSREPIGQKYYVQKDDRERGLEASPIRYAVWSIGPDPDSPKWNAPGYQSGWKPVPRAFWCAGAFDTGVVTHFMDQRARMHMSP